MSSSNNTSIKARIPNGGIQKRKTYSNCTFKKKKKSKDVGDEVEYRGEWRMDWSLEKGEGKKKNITLDQTVQQNPH